MLFTSTHTLPNAQANMCHPHKVAAASDAAVAILQWHTILSYTSMQKHEKAINLLLILVIFEYLDIRLLLLVCVFLYWTMFSLLLIIVSIPDELMAGHTTQST